jgi:hypothetical protein
MTYSPVQSSKGGFAAWNGRETRVRGKGGMGKGERGWEWHPMLHYLLSSRTRKNHVKASSSFARPKRGRPRGSSTEIRNPTATRKGGSRPSRKSGRVTLSPSRPALSREPGNAPSRQIGDEGVAGGRTHTRGRGATGGHGVMRGVILSLWVAAAAAAEINQIRDLIPEPSCFWPIESGLG